MMLYRNSIRTKPRSTCRMERFHNKGKATMCLHDSLSFVTSHGIRSANCKSIAHL
jgi:hypothetical protein